MSRVGEFYAVTIPQAPPEIKGKIMKQQDLLTFARKDVLGDAGALLIRAVTKQRHLHAMVEYDGVHGVVSGVYIHLRYRFESRKTSSKAAKSPPKRQNFVPLSYKLLNVLAMA